MYQKEALYPLRLPLKNLKKEYELVGKTTEGKGHEVHDPVFEMDIKYFGEEAIFKQRIKALITKDNITVTGFLEFMVCDDTNCLPPTEVEYTFEVGGQKVVKSGSQKLEVADNKKEDKSFLQTTITKDTSKKEKVVSTETSDAVKSAEKKEKNKSLWVLFGLSFLAGFAAFVNTLCFPNDPYDS